MSRSHSFDLELASLLPETDFFPVIFSDSAAGARKEMSERHFELLIVNPGREQKEEESFAIETVKQTDAVVLFLTKEEDAQITSDALSPYGVFILPKPVSKKTLSLTVSFMCAAYERMTSLRQKSDSAEQKAEEIKEVNRAKWLLIYNLKMTEPEAHRYIEKQAMDRCVTRLEVAKSIVRTYS